MATVHRILAEGAALDVGERLAIEGDEARHAARAKRLRVGDVVELLNGRGAVATGRVERIARERGGAVLTVQIEAVQEVQPVLPRLVVAAATPKGGRVDELVDALSQVGAAVWRPLITARSVVEPRRAKLERLRRIAAEASKQCGRAWTMELGGPVPLAELLGERARRDGERGEEPQLVVADASGRAFRATGAAEIHLLIGPEGGFSEEELGAAHDAGAEITSFGVHTMRIETAAVVAAGIVMEAESALRQHGRCGAGMDEEEGNG